MLCASLLAFVSCYSANRLQCEGEWFVSNNLGDSSNSMSKVESVIHPKRPDPRVKHGAGSGKAWDASSKIPSHSLRVQPRATVAVKVGKYTVGAGAPVVVQSMTNTDTADLESTVQQVAELAKAGSELVRITVNNEDSARQVPYIRDRLDAMGVDVPLVGDFHFNGHTLLEKHPACAEALAKYRINPGNVGKGSRRDPQFAKMIELACQYDKPIRIGVNWGSLDQDLLARLLDDNAASKTPRPLNEVTHAALIVLPRPKSWGLVMTKLFCRARCQVCKTSSKSIATWLLAVITRFI